MQQPASSSAFLGSTPRPSHLFTHINPTKTNIQTFHHFPQHSPSHHDILRNPQPTPQQSPLESDLLSIHTSASELATIALLQFDFRDFFSPLDPYLSFDVERDVIFALAHSSPGNCLIALPIITTLNELDEFSNPRRQLVFPEMHRAYPQAVMPCTNGHHVPVGYLQRPSNSCGFGLKLTAPHVPSKHGHLTCIYSTNFQNPTPIQAQIVLAPFVSGNTEVGRFTPLQAIPTYADIEIDFDYITDATAKTKSTYNSKFRQEIDDLGLLDLKPDDHTFPTGSTRGSRDQSNRGQDPLLLEFPEPRIDHLLLRFSNLPSSTTDLVDFTIAFDHAEQTRIDRIGFWDNNFLSAIKSWWMLNNDRNVPVARCGDNSRLVIQETGNAGILSLALVPPPKTGPDSTTPWSGTAVCIIPIPIHAVHEYLTTLPQLDLADWNGKQIAVYLQMVKSVQSQRLFRYHTTALDAKWDFLNPILSSTTTMTSTTSVKISNNEISEVALEYTFTVSGPNPNISISNIYPTEDLSVSKEFLFRLFDPSSTGFLTSFYYITNPPDIDEPDTYRSIDPSFFTQSLQAQTSLSTPISPPTYFTPSNYNGYLHVILKFTIPALQSRPFDITWNINNRRFNTHFLPAPQGLKEFSHLNNDSLGVQLKFSHTHTFALQGISDAVLHLPADTPPIPFNIEIQPRFTPFELLTTKTSPSILWTILDENQQEIPQPPNVSVNFITNNLLSTIYSPTHSTPVKVSNLILSLHHTISIRLIYDLKPSTNKPPLSSGDQLGYLRYLPTLYSHSSVQLNEVPQPHSARPQSMQSTPLSTTRSDLIRPDALITNKIASITNKIASITTQADMNPTQYLDSLSQLAGPEPYKSGPMSSTLTFIYHSPTPIRTTEDIKSMLQIVTNKVNSAQFYKTATSRRSPIPLTVTEDDWRFDDSLISSTLAHSTLYPHSLFSQYYTPNRSFSDVNVETLSHHSEGATIALAIPIELPAEFEYEDRVNFARHNWNEDLSGGKNPTPSGEAGPILLFETVSDMVHLYPPISASLDKIFAPSPNLAEQQKAPADFLEMPLPSYAYCQVDGNCQTNALCLKNHCIPLQYLLGRAKRLTPAKLFTPRELHLYHTYSAALTQPGIFPSEFNISMTKPVPQPKDSLSILLLIIIIIFASVVTGVMAWCGFVCCKKRRKRKHEDAIELMDVNQDSEEDEDEEDEDDSDEDDEYDDKDDQ